MFRAPYRVVRIGDDFYPQERILLFWYANFDQYYCMQYGLEKETCKFRTLAAAWDFLVERRRKNKTTVVWRGNV
jgi:uncharacterized protein YwqG